MQKLAQNSLEAIIPILGFYYWDWSWYFILLFYILDGLAKEIILHLKSQKVYATQGGESAVRFWQRSGIKSAFIVSITTVILHFMYYINHANVDFLSEVIGFLSYKEMGLAQGWVLVPLIGLNVWMQYKFNFLKIGLHTKTKMSSLWGEHLRIRILYLIVVIIGLGIHSVFHLADFVFVWASVALPFLFEFLIKPEN